MLRDDLGLVGLAHRAEMGDRLVARQDATRDLLVAPGQLGHLRLDRREVLGREGPLVGEVVVEAVLDHRPDRHLGVGEELLDRVGEQVRRRVADQVEAVGVLLGDDGQAIVVIDRVAGVDEPARGTLADPAAERGLGQAGADRRGDLLHRHRAGEFASGSVGQLNRDHGKAPAMKKARTSRASSRGRRGNGMRGRAATYTLRPEVRVRGVITGMPFSLLSVCSLGSPRL